MADNKIYDTNSLGYKLKFQGPATPEDYDRVGGKTGLCVEDAVENTIYRSTLPEWQEAFAKELEKLLGVTRTTDADATAKAKTRSKKPDSVKDISERVKAFNARVTAGLPDKPDPNDPSIHSKESVAALAQKIADSIMVDPSPSKRASGPGKDLLAKADSILTLPTDQIETKITKYSEKVPSYELARDEAGVPDRDSLARLLGQYLDAVLAED